MSQATAQTPSRTVRTSAVGGGAAGIGGGAVVVYLLSLIGVDITPYAAAAVAGAASTAATVILRLGVKGVFRVIWEGEGNDD